MKTGRVLFLLAVCLAPLAHAYVHEVFSATEEFIQKTKLDYSSPQEIIASTTKIRQVAVHANHVYWAEGYPYRIMRANLDGANAEELIQAQADLLCIDKQNQKLYWVDGTDIFRANLDGTLPETILSFSTTISSLDIHYPSGKLYFMCAYDGNIRRTNLDGSNLEEFVPEYPNFPSHVLDNSCLSVADNTLYICTDSSDYRFIYQTTLLGENCVAVYQETEPRIIYHLHYNPTDNMLYFAYIESGNFTLGVRRFFLGHAQTETVATFNYLIPSALMSFDISNSNNTSSIWYSSQTTPENPPMSIMMNTLPQRTILATTALDTTCIKAVFEPNASTGTLFWSEMPDMDYFPAMSPGGGALYRVDSNGANYQTLLSGLNSIVGIEVDVNNDCLYWTDPLEPAIYRASLDGSNITNITSHLPSIGMPIFLALDKAQDILYWSELQGNIIAMNLQTGEKRLVVGGLSLPFGLTLDSDAATLYFSANSSINSIQTDGTNRQLLYAGHAPSSISLDEADHVLYYPRGSSLYRLPASGGTPENLGFIGAWPIALRTINTPTITLLGPPRASVGDAVTLRVGSLPPLSGHVAYEWYKDDILLPDATGPEYTIPSLALADGGVYHLMITDESKGIYRSAPFTLTVVDGPLPVAGTAGMGIVAGLIIACACRRLRRR